MKKISALFILVTLLGVGFLIAGNEEVVGDWEMEVYVDVVGQTYPGILTMGEAEGKLNGNLKTDYSSYEIRNPKYEEGELTFSIMHEEAGLVDFKVRVSGKEMKGTAGNYDFTGDVTGKRKE